MTICTAPYNKSLKWIHASGYLAEQNGYRVIPDTVSDPNIKLKDCRLVPRLTIACIDVN